MIAGILLWLGIGCVVVWLGIATKITHPDSDVEAGTQVIVWPAILLVILVTALGKLVGLLAFRKSPR